MNLRLKLKRKNLVSFAAITCLVLFLSILIPLFRTSLLDTFECPLSLLRLVRRELKGIIFYHRNLIQNDRLKKEIDLLRQRFSQLNELSQENKRLKELLVFKQRAPYKVIAAQIIGRSPDSWSSIIIIDKGRYNGIKPDMPVITYLGLAGRVIEVSKSTSKIMLINDPDFAISGMVQRSRQEGLVCGSLGGSLLMRYLPKDADIKPQDIIITSGLNERYPKGLLIGQVVDLVEEFSGLSRYAVVKPRVELSSIEEVLIIVQ